MFDMSRPKLIDTEKFLGCRDRVSSRLIILMYVRTEASQDWTKDVHTRQPKRRLTRTLTAAAKKVMECHA